MEREHYRRVVGDRRDEYTTRAQRGQTGTVKKAGRGERMLTQCMVCGIALAVLLIMSLINTNFTNSVRANLRSAIGGQASMDQVRSAYETVEGKIQSVFGKTPATDMPAANTPAANGGVKAPPSASPTPNIADAGVKTSPTASPANTGSQIPSAATPDTNDQADSAAATPLDVDFRIDEDILRDLNAS